MRRRTLVGCLPVLLLAVGAACGPTPPDWAGLAGHSVEVCGETFGADEIVRRAYDGASAGALPADVSLPVGAIAASTAAGDDTIRRYPCAVNANQALLHLQEMGYRDAVRVGDDARIFAFSAIDPYGVAGTYTLFDCDFVGEVESRRDGTLVQQGLFGAFGENGGGPVDDEMIRDLAALTFATGMTPLASEGRPRFVDGPTLLGSEDEVGPVPLGPDEEGEGLGVCVTWVEPDFWGGCDFIRVGVSRTAVLDRQNGAFRQLAIHNALPHHGFPGWCGRVE